MVFALLITRKVVIPTLWEGLCGGRRNPLVVMKTGICFEPFHGWLFWPVSFYWQQSSIVGGFLPPPLLLSQLGLE